MKNQYSIFLGIVGILICSSFISDKLKYELQLSDEIVNRKTIPNKYKNDTLTKYLILRSPIKRYVRLKGVDRCMIMRRKSKLRKLPDWISNFKQLKAIDLIGNPDFQYSSELKKIRKLEKLEFLAIETSKFDVNLLEELIMLKSLKELHIKKYYEKSDSLKIVRIEKTLKNCKVEVSEFADYSDSYFTKEKNNNP